jgi:hypothetical protein
VLEQAEEMIYGKQLIAGVVGKADNGTSPASVIAPFMTIEHKRWRSELASWRCRELVSGRNH